MRISIPRESLRQALNVCGKVANQKPAPGVRQGYAQRLKLRMPLGGEEYGSVHFEGLPSTGQLCLEADGEDLGAWREKLRPRKPDAGNCPGASFD